MLLLDRLPCLADRDGLATFGFLRCPALLCAMSRRSQPVTVHGLRQLVRLAPRRVPDPLDQRRPVRVELSRSIDGFRLPRQDGARPLRVRSPDGVVTLRPTLDEKLILVHGPLPRSKTYT